jgi:dienelactone hydrolase
MARAARVVVLAALVGALTAVAAPSASAFPKLGPGCVRADYASGGRPVPAELCRPSRTKAAVPAAVVVHGCGGFGSLDGSLAHQLPRVGIATLYVDFFAQTPPPPGHRGYCGGGGDARDVWTTWQREVVDGAAALRRTRGVDARRVGVVAWSLGGGVALDAAVASRSTGRGEVSRPFDAMVIYSSYDDGPALTQARRLPPTLLLSAGTTDAVPESGAIALHRALVAAHVPSELRVWPHGRHSWPGAQGVQGLRWTTRFLHRYLG